MPPRMKLDRDPLGGLADMFGQMPGNYYYFSEEMTPVFFTFFNYFDKDILSYNPLVFCVFYEFR